MKDWGKSLVRDFEQLRRDRIKIVYPHGQREVLKGGAESVGTGEAEAFIDGLREIDHKM